jgi:hypothetical protein
MSSSFFFCNLLIWKASRPIISSLVRKGSSSFGDVGRASRTLAFFSAAVSSSSEASSFSSELDSLSSKSFYSMTFICSSFFVGVLISVSNSSTD